MVPEWLGRKICKFYKRGNYILFSAYFLEQINYRQFGFVLGLLSQAQRGEELDTSSIGEHTPPPQLEGLKV